MPKCRVVYTEPQTYVVWLNSIMLCEFKGPGAKMASGLFVHTIERITIPALTKYNSVIDERIEK